MQFFLQRPKFVLIACQPKTGSTFLTRTVSHLHGCRHVRLVPGYDRREQEICEKRLVRYRFRREKRLIAQHHVRYSEPIRRLIDEYNISVVVLVRDLYDAVISLRDHIRNESNIAPMFYLGDVHRSWPDEQLEQAIARLAIPWYLNFYMAWRDFPGALLLNYEEIATNPRDAVAKVCDFAEIPSDLSSIETAIAAANGTATRFNKGIVGRGAELSGASREIICNLVRIYSEAYEDDYLTRMLAKA